jgi:hypothetical protein
MTSQRSHAHVELGRQLYPILEQCPKPEVLWAKLATGRYDWLGVRRNGKYVLGRPRLSAVVAEDPSAPLPDDARDPHRIECLGPLQRIPRWESYPTADEARETFARMGAGDPITPLQNSGIWQARLVLDGRSAEERLVVRPLPGSTDPDATTPVTRAAPGVTGVVAGRDAQPPRTPTGASWTR